MDRSLITFALSLSFCVPVFAATDSKKIPFRQAIDIAVEKSPSLSTARSELNIRDLEYANSYSAFLPSLDLSATHGLRDSNPSIYKNIFASELSLQLAENLYDNGISLAKYESARFQKEIAELNYRNERDKLVLDLAFEYMHYSLAANLAQVQEQQFNIINKQYQSVSNQYQQGVKTRRDYLRFKTELRRSEIELQNSRTTLEKSRFELMRLLGFDVSSQIQPFDFDPVDVDLKSVEQVPIHSPDLASHYQYRIAGLQRKSFENDVYIVRRDYWPQLFLTAGATYHTGDYLGANDPLSQNESTSWNALLTLKFNLWDWGIRHRNISIADAKRTQAENTIASNLNTFSSANAKMMLELNQSSKNFAIARELLDLETKSYGFLESEYRNGKVSYLDIIVGLRDLLNAKVQMYTSYFDLRGQLLRYRYHEGRLYESVSEE
jgi:outer membrane protein TolC